MSTTLLNVGGAPTGRYRREAGLRTPFCSGCPALIKAVGLEPLFEHPLREAQLPAEPQAWQATTPNSLIDPPGIHGQELGCLVRSQKRTGERDGCSTIITWPSAL